MAITSVTHTETGRSPRVIYYTVTDDSGGTYNYGPVIANDLGFDATAFRVTVAERFAVSLAEAEFEELIA